MGVLFFCELYVIRDELALLGRTAHHPRSWASTSYNYNRSWASTSYKYNYQLPATSYQPHAAAGPRATAADIQQNHCLLPAMGALLLLGRTFKPDQYLPPVRQISGSHEKSNRPGHRAPRCSHSKLQQLPITLAPTQRLLNPLKTHSSNTRNFAVQILPRHQQKLEHKHST